MLYIIVNIYVPLPPLVYFYTSNVRWITIQNMEICLGQNFHLGRKYINEINILNFVYTDLLQEILRKLRT